MSLDRVTMIGNPTAISVAFKTQKDDLNSEPVEGISVVGEKQLSADEMITAERFIPLSSLSLNDTLREEIGSAAAGVYSELNKDDDDVLNFVASEFAHDAVSAQNEAPWPLMWYELA